MAVMAAFTPGEGCIFRAATMHGLSDFRPISNGIFEATGSAATFIASADTFPEYRDYSAEKLRYVCGFSREVAPPQFSLVWHKPEGASKARRAHIS